MTRGGTKYDGSPSQFDHGSIGRLAVDSPHDRGTLDQTNRDRSSNWSIIGQLAVYSPHDRDELDQINRDLSSNWSIIGRRRQEVKEPSIAVRSSRDRGAIEPRPHFFRWEIVFNRSAGNRQRVKTTIVARSQPDCGRNRGYLEAKLMPNSHRFVAELKPQSMPTESPPRRHQTASTIAPITHDFKPDFLFKNNVFLPLFFNF